MNTSLKNKLIIIIGAIAFLAPSPLKAQIETSMDSVEVYTDLGNGQYNWQQGSLTLGYGFIPLTSQDIDYGRPFATQDEVAAVSGLVVIPESLWVSLNSTVGSGYFANFVVSSSSYPLNGVPYLIINFAGGSVAPVVNPGGGAGGGGGTKTNSSGCRITNISTRGVVGTGGNILIAGFVIGGAGTETVLVRADGPALAAFGVAGTLAKPQLQIVDSAGKTIATIAGWGKPPAIGPSAAGVTATVATAADMNSVGAFAFLSGSADAALKLTLPPGSYTAEVAGADGGTGVALVEVYEMQ